MRVAAIDIGSPGKNLGWALSEPARHGTDIDECIAGLAQALRHDGLALGFEAPMFVPLRDDPKKLTAARTGECGGGGPNRPFSAGAGAAVLVTGLVVVPYVLRKLREMVPAARATLDWRAWSKEPGALLLFEAFVTNQAAGRNDAHVEDAQRAIGEFSRRIADPQSFESSIDEPDCLNLLGAMMLRTGWASDLSALSQPCLVVRAMHDELKETAPSDLTER
jgi:hypothetical protein